MVRNALLSLGLAAAAAASPLLPRQNVECVSGLYILVARGSTQVGAVTSKHFTSGIDAHPRILVRALWELLPMQLRQWSPIQ